MSQQSFEVAFFTIGEFEGLSADDTTRTAHIDVPALPARGGHFAICPPVAE